MSAFDLIAIVYVFFAAGVAVRLWRNRGRTFDDEFSDHDRRLAGSAAFYFVIPAVVALHELGHAVALWGFGAGVEDWHYMFYWAYVVPDRELGPQQGAAVSFAGNLVSILVAALAILWTLRRPWNAAWNFFRFEVARILLWLTLVFYPLFSLLIREGDFWLLRQDLNELQSHLGDGFLILWGGMAFWTWRRWRTHWRETWLWLATPLHDRLRTAERRLEADPASIGAVRELGRIYLAGDEPDRALATVRRGLVEHPEEAELRFLAGFAHLRRGEPQAASQELRIAGQLAEEDSEARSELLFEITLGLAAARLALGDPEGAVLTAEAARVRRPLDPRVTLMHADALVGAGRLEEARSRLETALDDAHGAFRKEIQRRLAALSRRG